MPFDPNVYATLASVDPAAAQAYLTAAAQPAAAPPLPQAQPQQGTFFSNPAALAAQPQPAARGTLEDFFNQQTGGGGPSVTSKFFNQRQQGSWLQLEVVSDVTNADVVHQKEPGGKLSYYKKNGQDDLTRPKLVLVVKVRVLGSSDGSHAGIFPDGEAAVWLKPGEMADSLRTAMAQAGDPSGYPKGGAQIVMQSAGEKPSRTPGYSATKLFNFQYAGPAGMAAEAVANSQADLQAVAQAASGFANPTTQIPSATAPVPSAATATSVPPATATSAVQAPPPAPGPSIPNPPVPAGAASPPAVTFQAPAVTGVPDKAELLARLHGTGA